jgi:hypothetical protein
MSSLATSPNMSRSNLNETPKIKFHASNRVQNNNFMSNQPPMECTPQTGKNSYHEFLVSSTKKELAKNKSGKLLHRNHTASFIGRIT